jgi:hypothetical protein
MCVGAILALSIGLAATFLGFDRDRAFYPTLMIVIASYYALFAIMGGSAQVLVTELLVIIVFVAAAIAGYKWSLWLVVAALAAHGLFDVVHGGLVANAGVPLWWPRFCAAFDIVAAGYLATILVRFKPRATASQKSVAETTPVSRAL